ncbi:hypothetical protein GCM10009665_78550 [Kitasatospora nipponensis]|uniref:Uncharacterized protein n=1 Tax=Kitasatospora nipponensis TaxID=258049 RepID=A0ABP4DWW3_9ACTN
MTISYYAGDDEYEYEYRHQRGQHARFEEPVFDLSHPPAYATAPAIASWGL